MEQAFRLALDVCPDLPEVRAEIGRSMLRLMMVDEALVQLHRALELAEEHHGRGWGGRAAVLHAVGHAYAVNSELDKVFHFIGKTISPNLPRPSLLSFTSRCRRIQCVDNFPQRPPNVCHMVSPVLAKPLRHHFIPYCTP